MRVFRVSYCCSGYVDVRANTEEEALDKFNQLADEELSDGVQDVEIADIMCEEEE